MSITAPPTSLAFTVTRCKPELVSPSKPTPKESKELSDIDDQQGLRFHVPEIQFYANNPGMEGRDPVKVIRDALANTLVYYYPLAGRLREGGEGKLIVDCNGEGVLFIEADADVTLDQLGDALHPPFPWWEQLCCDVPDSGELLKSPLFLIQVTRLRCGGFIFGLLFNHTMCDGTGLLQFMTAMGEMARGMQCPSIPPTWHRELLTARNPPCITCTHHEYDQGAVTKENLVPHHDMVQHSFFFSPTNVSTLRKLVPPHITKCSTFELITACIWRCRTIALQIEPAEEVRFACVVDARSKLNPPLPSGYYGNVIVSPAALTTAQMLCQNLLGCALEEVRKAKYEATQEYVRSATDLIVLRGRRPKFMSVNSYSISDLSRAPYKEVDFGWGKATYGGPPFGVFTWNASFYIAYKNKSGENGILVPICLPPAVMARFIKELKIVLEDPTKELDIIRDHHLPIGCRGGLSNMSQRGKKNF